jgi:hypothetical protein
MSNWDLLSLSWMGSTVKISSTDPEEVAALADVLVSHWGDEEPHRKRLVCRKYVASYFFGTLSTSRIGEESKIYREELLYYLFTIARSRGWQPFGSIGQFLRVNGRSPD